DQGAQRRAGTEQVGLSHDLVERAGPHAGGEGCLLGHPLLKGRWDLVVGPRLRSFACRHLRELSGALVSVCCPDGAVTGDEGRCLSRRRAAIPARGPAPPLRAATRRRAWPGWPGCGHAPWTSR